jgi:hypothetical protein
VITSGLLSVQLLNAATAANGAPSGASAGLELNSIKYANDGAIVLKSTAGSGDMIVTCRLWVYSTVSATWHPAGSPGSSDATIGTINAESAMGETGTDAISHAEGVTGLRHFDRIYLEITAIEGTSTAISAWLVARV